MASGLIGALRVDLSLDSAKFEAGTKRARSVAQRDATAIQKSLSGIKGSLNGLIVGSTIAAFTAATKRALDYAGGLGEVAQQVGATTKDLQTFRYVATQVGVEQEEMDRGLAKLTKTMGEAANGSKKQATAFRELGVSLQDGNGKMLTAGAVLPRLADAFARIKDPATRARIEAELFGKAGQKLDPLLTQGAKGIKALQDRAEQLGLVLGDDLIKAADDASDKLAEMQKQLEVNFARAVANSADAIVGLANAFGTLTTSIITFMSKYPQLTGVLAGVALGARAGIPGMVAGATAGLVGGEYLSQAQNDANMDPAFRAKALKNATARWRGARAASSPGSSMSTMGMAGGISSGPGAADAAWKEVERQWSLFNQSKATSSKAAAAADPGVGALPTVAPSGSGKKGPKDRTQDYIERYERELAALAEDQLQLQQEITTDAHERARLEHLRLDTTNAAYQHDVENREKAGELTAAQAEQLRLAHEANTTREHTLVNWKLDDELTAQELDLTRSQLENQSVLLRGELEAARTQADRRRIQLAILDHEQALERASLEALIARHDATEADKEIARAKLNQLATETGQRATAIRRDTMGPMESYLHSLPRTADELKERFEGIRVDALNNGLDLASRNVLKLKGVAGDLFNQLIADTIRLNLQSALTSGSGLLGSLGKMLGLAQAGSGIATSAGASLSSVGGGMVPKFAGGGTLNVGGIPGVDRNVLAINGIPRAMVSANENIKFGYGNDAGVARVEIVEAPGFAARVVGISGDVSIRTVGASNRAGAKRQTRRLA